MQNTDDITVATAIRWAREAREAAGAATSWAVERTAQEASAAWSGVAETLSAGKDASQALSAARAATLWWYRAATRILLHELYDQEWA